MRAQLYCLSQAMLAYHRLCADPDSGTENRRSALPLVRDGLRETPKLFAILQSLVQVDQPLTTQQLIHRLKDQRRVRSNIPAQMLTLLGYSLVERCWLPRGHGLKGGEWHYHLSTLGMAVMESEAHHGN